MSRNLTKSQKIRAASQLYQKVKRGVIKELKANNLELSKDDQKELVHKVYLNFKGQKARNVLVGNIRKITNDLKFGDEKVIAEKYYNPINIDFAVLTGIPWWEMDDFLTTNLAALVTPLNVRFEVNGGDQYGTTGMMSLFKPNGGFNYEYISSGLSQIIEKLRIDVENKSGPEWNGAAVIRKGRQDDGRPSSYFIQFTLVDSNGNQIPPTKSYEETEIVVPEPAPETKRLRRKDVIERQKELERKRREELDRKSKRQRQRPDVKIREGEKQKPVPPPPKAPLEKGLSAQERAANIQAILDRQEKQLERLERLVSSKIISKKDFLAQSQAIIDQTNLAMSKFDKGGQI